MNKHFLVSFLMQHLGFPIRPSACLGSDHPDTLAAANNLICNLRELGEHERTNEVEKQIRSQRGT